MKNTLIEVTKFVVRLGLLIGLPILIANVSKLTGTAQTVVGVVLPITLPIIDKWIHEDARIPASGILPL